MNIESVIVTRKGSLYTINIDNKVQLDIDTSKPNTSFEESNGSIILSLPRTMTLDFIRSINNNLNPIQERTHDKIIYLINNLNITIKLLNNSLIIIEKYKPVFRSDVSLNMTNDTKLEITIPNTLVMYSKQHNLGNTNITMVSSPISVDTFKVTLKLRNTIIQFISSASIYYTLLNLFKVKSMNNNNINIQSFPVISKGIVIKEL